MSARPKGVYRRQWKCRRCGHVWIARKQECPVRCAGCKQINWDRKPIRFRPDVAARFKPAKSK